jgi:hypothetical protein
VNADDWPSRVAIKDGKVGLNKGGRRKKLQQKPLTTHGVRF